MPTTDVMILSAVVAAFAVFAVVLAWAEYQTRHLRPILRPAMPKVDNGRPLTSSPTRPAAAITHTERTAA